MWFLSIYFPAFLHFLPALVFSKISPGQFSLFTIFQLFHSSRVSRQHPGRCVRSAHTPQTNSHKVCSLLEVLEDNTVTNSETSVFPSFPLFLLIALPPSSISQIATEVFIFPRPFHGVGDRPWNCGQLSFCFCSPTGDRSRRHSLYQELPDNREAVPGLVRE